MSLVVDELLISAYSYQGSLCPVILFVICRTHELTECTPASAVTCADGLTCEAGEEGYTCNGKGFKKYKRFNISLLPWACINWCFRSYGTSRRVHVQYNANSSRRLRKERKKRKKKYRGFPRVMILPAVGSKGFQVLAGGFWSHLKIQPVGSGPVEKFIYLASRVVSGQNTSTSSGSGRVMSREIRVAHGSS